MEGGESGWQIRWRIRRKIREGSSLLAAGFVTARSVSDDTPGRRRERREIRDREIKTSGGWPGIKRHKLRELSIDSAQR